MRYFYVDTENVQTYTFLEDWNVNSSDRVIMFVSTNSKNIKVADLQRFTNCSATIEYEDAKTGEKNAMDFQMVACLGLYIAKQKSSDECSHYIVSNDNGFKMPVEYLKEKTGVTIEIIKSEVDREVHKLIKKCIDLNNFNKELTALYGGELARNVYWTYKPQFVKYKTIVSQRLEEQFKTPQNNDNIGTCS